jgi:hydroxymethylpyrimidine/phosphomethylpyrimidine kinase
MTAQNTTGVRAIQESTPEFLRQQLDAVFEDIYPDAVKIGMTASSELIRVIADRLRFYGAGNVVVDPVMVASAGDSIAKEKTADSMKKYLLDKSILVTPNVSEAEKLSNMKIETEEDAVEAAFKIGKYCSVIITGGHLNGTNIIYNKQKDELTTIHQDLIESDNVHGTGCSFSAAVTANLVRLNNKQKIADGSSQNNLELSIQNSLKFVYESVKNGRDGTLNPNFNSKPFII